MTQFLLNVELRKYRASLSCCGAFKPTVPSGSSRRVRHLSRESALSRISNASRVLEENGPKAQAMKLSARLRTRNSAVFHTRVTDVAHFYGDITDSSVITKLCCSCIHIKFSVKTREGVGGNKGQTKRCLCFSWWFKREAERFPEACSLRGLGRC